MPEKIDYKVYLAIEEAVAKAKVAHETIYRSCKEGVVDCLKRPRGVLRYIWLVEQKSLDDHSRPQHG